MKLHYLFSAASAAVLICGAAHAQNSSSAVSQPPATDSTAAPDSMSQNSSSTVNPPAGAPAPSATDPSMSGAASAMPAPSAATGVAADTAAATGANVTVRTITNGPVPDTAENRERFPPLSNAGRRSKPAGN